MIRPLRAGEGAGEVHPDELRDLFQWLEGQPPSSPLVDQLKKLINGLTYHQTVYISTNNSLLQATSVLQDWVMGLPLREQGSLVVGLRGGDTVPKNPTDSPERKLTAFLRFLVLNPADPREVDVPGAFFQSTPPEEWKPSDFGHYPEHWYAHLMHAFEVCAYRHPNIGLAQRAYTIYYKMAHNLHLNIETKVQFTERMSEDRIASGTVVS
jgi:hypothetical protein